MQPNTFYLSTAEYSQKNKQIVLEFSNDESKLIKRFKFFPSLFFSVQEIDKELVFKILSSYNSKKFNVFEFDKTLKIQADTFSDLKKISNLLFLAFNRKPFFVEPVRQFLIQQNWSFFDSFVHQFDSVFKEEKTVFPYAKLGLTSSISKTFDDLLKFSDSEAVKLAQLIALSNILFTSFDNIPPTPWLQTKYFIENILFKHGFCPKSFVKKKCFVRQNFFSRPDESSIELDFSPVLFELIQNKNIGLETINCNCCKPKSIHSQNVLPHSLIEVEFEKEGDFFESFSPLFSQNFHLNNASALSRERKKKDFFLNHFPVGPFSKKQKKFIPLFDALKLVKENRITLTNNFSLKWSCLLKKSFLAEELKDLKLKLSSIDLILKVREKNSFMVNGLMTQSILSKNHEFVFFSSYGKTLSNLISFVPLVLMYENSSFGSEIAVSLNSCYFSLVDSFKNFAEKNDANLINYGKKNAFLRGENAFNLVKTFFSRSKLPLPLLVKPF